eukprot:GILJ01032151.1.p1 GENE.GILJ01032151.1~~GILJ01032151.1.p1  ORF type:complete len:278 (-),score=21.12 GILJ01032151.1:171-1004(-)
MAQLATHIANIGATVTQQAAVIATISTTVTQQATTIADLNTTVTQQAAAIAGLSVMVRATNALNVLPSEAGQSHKTIRLDEQSKFDRICSDASLALSNVRLAIEQASHRFAFATGIVPDSAEVSFTTVHSVVKQSIGNRNITLRSSEPLSPKYHKWSMKVEVSSCQHFIMGLLPSLSSSLESQMTGTNANIGNLLGGWGIKANGTVTGNWSIDTALTYKQGDVVSFSYDFASQRLTITNGTQKAEGTIPANDGEKLYPSVYFHDTGNRISFVQFQRY